jgi:hypothetical protein
MWNTHIPAAFCKLVNLTELSLGLCPDNHVDLDMQWLYQLTALQSLHLYFTDVAMTIGQGFTQLSSLSTLSLNSDQCSIDVQWQFMHALQCVTSVGRLTLGPISLTFSESRTYSH